MKNTIFVKAGTFKDSRKVYFTSKCRKKNLSYDIYHHNDYTTEFIIPQKVFKENFIFDRSTGMYHNQLTYGQLKTLPGVKITIDYDPC